MRLTAVPHAAAPHARLAQLQRHAPRLSALPRATPRRAPARLRPRASADDDAEQEGEDAGGVAVRTSLTGEELRELVVAKFGRPYDTRLCQRRDRFNKLKMYLQIMWKFQGQKSFPMSAEAYAAQLDAVAELLTEWGVVEEACAGISSATTFPKVDTVGASAVSIPLSVEVGP